MAMIALCEGSDRPSTVSQVMHTRLGDTPWSYKSTVQIPTRRTGIAQWIVYVDGLDVRAVKVKPPAILQEEQVTVVDISKKSTPKLIL